MNFVVGQFIGGQVFFYGMALCSLGCLLRSFFRKALIHSLARITLFTGIVLVVLSAAPFSLWVYGLFFAFLAWALIRPLNGPWRGQRFAEGGGRAEKSYSVWPLLFFLLLSLFMVGTEILHAMPPKFQLAQGDTLIVVGDSICMGADPPGKNWPELLGDLAKLKVKNFSFGGATVATSLDNARRINLGDASVIVEIGGNDVLSSTSIPQFRADLEKMLALACGPRRRVAMIETPLPPFRNQYGQVQRALAREHGVTLIPKRYLASVMSTPGATVDGLHFSNAGHILFAQKLAEMLVRPAPDN